MNEVPLNACASLKRLLSGLIIVSMPRLTNRALAPSANISGLTGASMLPIGELGDLRPTSEVGEYCPLVSP